MLEQFKSDLALQTLSGRELASPDIQNTIEEQFGFLPEFHRQYDDFHGCHVAEYIPEKGYVRFNTLVIPSPTDYLTSIAVEYFIASGGITEYRLLDPRTKDRVSRNAFFTKDHNGKLELAEASIYYKEGNLDIEYQTTYDENLLQSLALTIYFNKSKDPVWFPYTKLVGAYRFADKPWEIQVAHGSLEQLEAYYRKQRKQQLIGRSEMKDYFPGVSLKLPVIGTDVLVYEGLQGLSLATEKPKQIDLMQLGRPKIITYRGSYLYLVNAGNEVSITRSAQEDSDKTTWEITLFNQDNKELDAAIKGDWVSLKDHFVARLVVK